MPVFVEPLSPPAGDAKPSEEMAMIELQRFPEVGQRLTAALLDAVSIFTNFDHLNREMFTVFDRDFHGH